jgi:heterodisulfide reductase subunit C
MTETALKDINIEEIKAIMDSDKAKMKLWLKVCAHCSLCAESSFLYTTRGRDPKYIPSHKFINSIGRLYKKRGKVDRESLEEIGDIVWNRCVLCTRCYCPFGIDIPEMIALGRKICRSQDIYRKYDEE